MTHIVIPRSTHRRLSASGCYRWTVCPRSPDFEATFPESISEFAAEGTVAHYVGEHSLLNGKPASDYIGFTIEADGFTFTVDKEMADYVQLYVNYCEELKDQTDNYGVEETFSLEKYHPDTGGTCDFNALVANTLHVVDFKYGRGVAVEAWNNQQMFTYALGAIEAHVEAGVPVEDKEVCITIIQPRASHSDGPIRCATYSWAEILFWGDTCLKPAAARCDDPGQPFVPGNHCRFCRAAGACATQQSHMKTVIKAYFNDSDLVLPDANQMTPDELDRMLNHSTEVRDWLKKVEATAQLLVERGKVVLPNHKLVRRNKKRVWRDSHQAEETLVKLLQEKAFKKTLLTVAQAEKLVGAKAVKTLWEKPEGEFLLVHNSDKRVEVTPNKQLDFLDSHDLLQ